MLDSYSRPTLQDAGDVERPEAPNKTIRGALGDFELDNGIPGGLPAADDPIPARKQSFKERYGALKPFAIISCSYLLFTITDGAIRMIVLLHGTLHLHTYIYIYMFLPPTLNPCYPSV
jgi:hypothetical protein